MGADEAIDWYLPLSNDKMLTFVNESYVASEHLVAGLLSEMPRQQDVEAFLRSLVRAERPTLVAQTTPYNENPMTAVFDLTGAADAIGQLADLCEWSLDDDSPPPRTTQSSETERERLYARGNTGALLPL